MIDKASLTRTTFRSIAIPNEHGGWMFLLEPVLIGLGAAFSAPGLFLALAALGVFLTRHPLKLALDDYLKQRHVPRTQWAVRFALLYAFFAASTFIAALSLAQYPFWIPLLLAAPLALSQIYLDAHKRSRELLAELAGAIAMGAVVACTFLLAGLDIKLALAAWAIVGFR
jgi:YwiC-like protein